MASRSRAAEGWWRRSISGFAVLLAGSVLLASAPAGAQDGRAIVARVRAYIERFEQETTALVADERYVQSFTRKVDRSETTSTREVRSDYVLVRPADGLPWLGYRDVYEVDGEPVRERDARVVRMLEGTATDSLERAAAFAREGSRFNLGPERTVNTPMMPMQLLGREHAGRIRMPAGRVARRNDRATVMFDEPSRPTIVRTPDGQDVWSSGQVVVRVSDGAILQATLKFRFVTGRIRDESSLFVDFGDVPGIPVPVPIRMTEQLPMPDGSRATGDAVYSNYRRFQTFARIR